MFFQKQKIIVFLVGVGENGLKKKRQVFQVPGVSRAKGPHFLPEGIDSSHSTHNGSNRKWRKLVFFCRLPRMTNNIQNSETK